MTERAPRALAPAPSHQPAEYPTELSSAPGNTPVNGVFPQPARAGGLGILSRRSGLLV